MAKNYQGAATLIVDGEETPVLVDLNASAVGNLREWHGSFQSEEGDALVWKALNGTAKLRMEDGREAPIVVNQGTAFQNGARFSGSGPAPF